jgi:hypothetical protein
MTKRVQVVLMLTVALAMMGLASCGHYICGANFGNSTCTPGTVGITGNNGGSASAAFVFLAQATSGSAGRIDGYTLNTTNSTLLPTSPYTAPTTPTGDPGVGMVVAQKQFLYTGFGTTNTIDGWSISPTGSLTAVSGSPYSALFMGSVSAAFGSQSIITNPAGTLLFFSAASQVYVYQIGTGGVLTAVTGSPFPVSFAGNMATDGLGKYLYITDSAFTNHTGSVIGIGAYAIGSSCATSGGVCTLTAVTGSPFSATNFEMWKVQGDPSGKFLVGTKGLSLSVNGSDDDHLYVFSIAQPGAAAPGAITLVGSPTPTTNSPFEIAVQSNTGGNLVYSVGLDDAALAFNPAEGFALNSSGALTQVTGSPFTNAAMGNLVQFDQSGSLLFTYGGIASSNGTVVFQMQVLDVGSGGNLTQAATNLVYGGFWAATDAP